MSDPRDNQPEGMKHIFNFMFKVARGELPERETLEFLQSAFIAIWQGQDANEALKLGKKSGHRDRWGEYVGIALAVEEQRLLSKNYDEACATVAEKIHQSMRNVKRRHEEYKHEARAFLETQRDNLKLVCAVLVEKELLLSADLNSAVATVSRSTGVASADVAKWHSEFQSDDRESLAESPCKPPTQS